MALLRWLIASLSPRRPFVCWAICVWMLIFAVRINKTNFCEGEGRGIAEQIYWFSITACTFQFRNLGVYVSAHLFRYIFVSFPLFEEQMISDKLLEFSIFTPLVNITNGTSTLCHLRFRWPCIVIKYYNKTNQMH